MLPHGKLKDENTSD